MVETFGFWWKDNDYPKILILEKDFTLEEAKTIFPQVFGARIKKGGGIFSDGGHLLIKLDKEKLYVFVSFNGSVELPYNKDRTQKIRIADRDKIYGFHAY